MKPDLKGRSFLTLLDYTPEEIWALLDFASELNIKKRSGTYDRCLTGKNIVLLFEKASTRTRCAFEVAAFDEGAGVTCLTDCHIGKKESIEDTARVLGRYYDGIEFRGYEQASVETLAKYAGVPVWNGLTDQYHPTQILADLMTIEEHVNKPLSEVNIVFVGDTHSNMGNSWCIGAAKMGMQFTGLGPKRLHADEALIDECKRIAIDTGAHIRYTEDIDDAAQGADVIYTDVWASMGEESHLEERIEHLKPYQVTMEMLTKTGNSDVKFMHCLPAFHDQHTSIGKEVFERFYIREMEVADDVFQSEHSIVFDQAENRLHTIKAIMVATLT